MSSTTFRESVTQKVDSLQKELENCRAVQDKYYRMLENTSEGFMLLDCDFTITEVNKSLLRISGYSLDDFTGNKIDKFYDKKSVNFYSASRNHLSFEALFRAGTGHEIPMLFSRSTLKDDDGRTSGYMFFLSDLTELKATQEELRRAEQRYRSMYQNAVQGMFQSRLSGELIRINPAYASLLGYDSPAEVLAIKDGADKFYFDPEDRLKMLRAVKKGGSVVNHELRLKRKDGKPVWILANIRLIDDDRGRQLLEGILVDNTKRKVLEKELRRDRQKFRNLANHDNLTGLFNTRYLYKSLDHLIESSSKADTPFSLVFMDMDNFKHVVDTYGHLSGSQALKEVAQTIKACLQKPCFGVAYGGDEFVVVLPGFSNEQAYQKAEEIRTEMKQTVYLTRQKHNVRLKASFGIATFPTDSNTRNGLLALADNAMFRIKLTGKDSVGISSPSTIR
jgi:diguanylate cyclase (GGDEF)-like protein/PAS domain S-box-containing protein